MKMKRKFYEDGSLDKTPEALDIVHDLSDHMTYPSGDGLYITEDYGDGRVKIERLDTSSGKDEWSELGVYWEYCDEAE